MINRSGLIRPLTLLVSATLAIGLGVARASSEITGRSTAIISLMAPSRSPGFSQRMPTA